MATNTESYNVFIEAGKEYNIGSDLTGCVHQQLLRKLRSKIVNNINKTEERVSNYLLTGKRGSGKSTFMKTLVSLLLNGGSNDSTSSEPADTPKVKLELLCWYDPSESVGCNDYFFLTIAAALKSKLQEVIHDRKKEDNDYNFLIDYCKTSMKKLDKGIVRLSNNKNALEGITPPGAAALRKDNPEFDEAIRENFAAVVDKICEIRRTDSLIIAIDDADSRSEQCFHVLENLRLYVSHPRLIILMTGDKNMLLERIRERLFREFDYKYHKADLRRRDARLDMVIAHASQYLIKLFPLNNQCELVNLQSLAHKNVPIHVKLTFNNDNKNGKEQQTHQLLSSHVKKLFSYAISTKEDEVQPYVDLFMRLPLRSILQVLNSWYAHNVWNNLAGAENKERRAQKEIIYAVKMSMKRVLEDELSSSCYNFESLDADDGRIFFSTMLRHCQSTGDLEHGYFLSGGVGLNEEERYITMLLATSFKDRVKSLSDFINYLLFGPATVSLYTKVCSSDIWNQGTQQHNHEICFQAFRDYMQVGRGISASRWARHANIILSYRGEHAAVQRITNINKAEIGTPRPISVTNGDSIGKEACELAINATLSLTDPRENAHLLSLYSYIAFIMRCCVVCEAATTEKAAEDDLIKLFAEYKEIKSCFYPNWFNRTNNHSSDEFQDKNKISCNYQYSALEIDITELRIKNQPYFLARKSKESGNSNATSIIANAIYQWHKKNADNIEKISLESLTPHAMAETWASLYYMIERINTKSSNENPVSPYDLFREAINIFLIKTLSPYQYKNGQFKEEPTKRSDTKNIIEAYKRAIGTFPLNPCLAFVFQKHKTNSK